MKTARRACILSVSGETLTPDEHALFSEMQPWAVILMGRSCVSRAQVRALVDDIWTALERPCLIFIDQEGGRVPVAVESARMADISGGWYIRKTLPRL
jgi:beta-glucosidase-like glycosyl hydrolase